MTNQTNTKQINIFEGLQIIDDMLSQKEFNRELTIISIQVISGIRQRLEQADKMEKELKELKDGDKDKDS